MVVLTMELDEWSDWMAGAFNFAPLFVGWAVLVSWITLLLGGWRSEARWIDRLGRATGLFWVLTGFAVAGLFVVCPFVSSCPSRFLATQPFMATGPVSETAQPLPLEPGR